MNTDLEEEPPKVGQFLIPGKLYTWTPRGCSRILKIAFLIDASNPNERKYKTTTEWPRRGEALMFLEKYKYWADMSYVFLWGERVISIFPIRDVAYYASYFTDQSIFMSFKTWIRLDKSLK